MTEPEVTAFLADGRTMNVATILPNGRPHLVAMWYDDLDGAPAFWTYTKSQKVLNLRRDPRITGLVEDGEEYAKLRGVELVGTGEVIDDRDTVQRFGERLTVRYNGGEVNDAVRGVVAQMGAKRVVVRINVEKVVSWDHGKLGGGY